jgi:hypothetical protein
MRKLTFNEQLKMDMLKQLQRQFGHYCGRHRPTERAATFDFILMIGEHSHWRRRALMLKSELTADTRPRWKFFDSPSSCGDNA